EDVVLSDEAHLQVKLVELARRTVGPSVFIAKTGRDLKVTVETRHHQELLELLGRLRQGVELAGMYARWHKVIASPLRTGTGQDWRVVLKEAQLDHSPANAGNHSRAQDDVLMQFSASQIEHAVAQAHLFRNILLGEDIERQTAIGSYVAQDFVCIHD